MKYCCLVLKNEQPMVVTLDDLMQKLLKVWEISEMLILQEMLLMTI